MIDRTVAAWRRCDAVDADPSERAARRRVSWSWDESGMLVLIARLHAEEVAADALVALSRAYLNGDGDTERDPDTSQHPCLGRNPIQP